METNQTENLQDVIVGAGTLIEEASRFLAGRPHNGRSDLGAARGLLAISKQLVKKCEALEARELEIRAEIAHHAMTGE